MILNAKDLTDGAVLEADICIVGAGPAGITAALELAKASGLKILLLESGGTYLEDETQDLYAGPNLGRPYEPLDQARLRFLGGSSNHWAGNCMRLTPVDFEERDWMPGSGWPISYDDIAPYYDLAAPYVQIQEDRPFDFSYWAEKIEGQPVDWNPDIFENTVSCSSPPTPFGIEYEQDLERAANISVVLYANVLEIETNETASEVTGLRVACIDGPHFRVRAKSYVLAQGGIEVARLLLLSDHVIAQGLGNAQDQVGRYFTDHVGIRPALWIWPDQKVDRFKLYEGPTYLDVGGFWGTVASSNDLRRRESIGGFTFYFMQTSNSPGYRSAQTIVRSLKKGDFPPYLSSHVMNIFSDLDGMTNKVYDVVTDKGALIDRSWLAPWLNIECVPNPDSRVRLVDEQDRLGQRRIGMDWKLTEQDLNTVKRATELMAQEIGRMGLGRVWTEALRDDYDWPGSFGLGKHACSTTRMSETPKTGVVDRNCRVHGVANLFVASSSVFRTSSFAQPTLSIVAFSIRLADHLKQLHKAGQP